MAEYIERTALRDALYADDAITMQGVKILNQFPAADVAPVVHGKWIFKSRWHDSIDENLCSKCGQLVTTAAEKQMDYCPNCGARMDGGAE